MEVLKLVAQGRLPAEAFVTHRFALDDIRSAYETFSDAARTHAVKVLISRQDDNSQLMAQLTRLAQGLHSGQAQPRDGIHFIGIMGDGVYGFDPEIQDVDKDDEEIIALAAATGYAAPQTIRAERIPVDIAALLDDDFSPANVANANSTANLLKGKVAGVTVRTAGGPGGDLGGALLPGNVHDLGQHLLAGQRCALVEQQGSEPSHITHRGADPAVEGPGAELIDADRGVCFGAQPAPQDP